MGKLYQHTDEYKKLCEDIDRVSKSHDEQQKITAEKAAQHDKAREEFFTEYDKSDKLWKEYESLINQRNDDREKFYAKRESGDAVKVV